MKKRLILTLTAGILVVGLSTVAFAGNTIKMFYNGYEIKADASPVNLNGRIYGPVRAIAEAMGAKVTWNKESNQVLINGNDQSRQIESLEYALAPKSNLDAVNSYAEGMKTRNGAWQYAVMTPELQKKSYDEMISSNWHTGASSPWIKSYEAKEISKIDENTYYYSVAFIWTDSTNSISESTLYFTVKNIDGTWLVDSVNNLDVKGEITKTNLNDKNKIVSVFVENKAENGAAYQQALVIIGEKTKIYKGYTNVELTADSLKMGTKVEAFFVDGPMLMIYPPQATAEVIRVF
jgi:hypothetical protein